METKPDMGLALKQLEIIITNVDKGHTSAYKAYAELKEYQKHLNDAMDYIKEDAVQEVSQRGGEVEYKDYKITTKSSAGRWNFKNVDKWNEKNEDLKSLEDQLKNLWKAKRSAFERGDNLQSADKEGEEVQLPEYKEGSQTVSIRKL